MNDSLSFLGQISDEDKLLAGRVLDSIRLSEDKYINKFTFFLDEHQRALCEKVLASVCFKNYMFFGGYETAERNVLGIFAPYNDPDEKDFPIKALSFSYRPADRLSHRDFLGCLMSLGIERDTVGDIIVSDGKTAVFLYETVSGRAVMIDKIGRVGVKVNEGFDLSIIPKQEYIVIEGTVASLRIDSVLGLVLRISREKASALIRSGNIQLNHTVNTSTDHKLAAGDIISARGYGKFRLDEIGALTKKERIHIVVKKFK